MDKRTKCSVPNCPATPVGKTTHEINWHVCELHYLSAAGCGFLPRRYGDDTRMMPDRAAELVREMSE